MKHECNFELDKDGQITCSICSARDDVTPPFWGDVPVSFEE